MAKLVMVLTTVPNKKECLWLAGKLLRQRLCACVSALPKLESRYWWQGHIEKSAEVLLLIKTSVHKRRALIEAIEKHHPYDVPEIIALPVAVAGRAYERWVTRVTTS